MYVSLYGIVHCCYIVALDPILFRWITIASEPTVYVGQQSRYKINPIIFLFLINSKLSLICNKILELNMFILNFLWMFPFLLSFLFYCQYMFDYKDEYTYNTWML